jgi:hypothetical protein
MLLADALVLTCAHVLQDVRLGPGDEVLVDFAGLPGSPRVRAIAVADGWVPPREDNSADIALLRLEPGAPDVPGAPLRRLPDHPEPHRRTVRTFGFPYRDAPGVWAFATLAGPSGPGGEWVQLDSQLPGQRVRRGFSGAGVLDDLTGAVVGMVVTELTDPDARLAWMIPVATLAGYADQVAKLIGPDLAAPPPEKFVVVVGGPIAKGLDPSLGEVTTTVDTTGRTPAEVHRRIEDRFSTTGIDPTDSAKAPVTVVLTGIDASHHPEALLNDVAKPLLDAGTEVEFRFSDETSPGLALARRWQREEIDARIGKLAARVEEVDTVEAATRHHGEAVARICGPVPEVPWLGVELQLRVRALADVPAEVELSRVRRALASTERKAERAMRKLAASRIEVDVVRDRYEELKGLLRVYNARAKDHGLVEDERLAALHRPAAEAIAAAPCSVPEAEPLVEAYVHAVRERLAGGRP